MIDFQERVVAEKSELDEKIKCEECGKVFTTDIGVEKCDDCIKDMLF